MVYQENFIVSIKSCGKILREDKGYVTIPFGSEYSILLKNLDSRKAVVGISIDGKSVITDGKIIVEPEKTVELKGAEKDNEVKNRFKFIKKTDEIVEHRGDRIDDGIIRVEVTFEEAVYEKKVVETPVYWWSWCEPAVTIHNWPTLPENTYYPVCIENSGCNDHITYAYMSSSSMVSDGSTCSSKVVESTYTNNIKDDEGITVKGSETKQKFVPGYVRTLEKQSVVFVIRLRGMDNENNKIDKPIFTKDKIICKTCGRNVKYSANYCGNCGTKR